MCPISLVRSASKGAKNQPAKVPEQLSRSLILEARLRLHYFYGSRRASHRACFLLVSPCLPSPSPKAPSRASGKTGRSCCRTAKDAGLVLQQEHTSRATPRRREVGRMSLTSEQQASAKRRVLIRLRDRPHASGHAAYMPGASAPDECRKLHALSEEQANSTGREWCVLRPPADCIFHQVISQRLHLGQTSEEPGYWRYRHSYVDGHPAYSDAARNLSSPLSVHTHKLYCQAEIENVNLRRNALPFRTRRSCASWILSPRATASRRSTSYLARWR